MWPWGHLAAGYLLYRGLDRTRVPDAVPVLLLALGTQIPDLIDKPLAWTIPLLPNGRSLGHSLVIALPILLGLLLLTDGRRRRLVISLATGYLTHLGTDALYPALDGNWYYVGFLGWPIVPPIEYPGESTGIIRHFFAFELTVTSGFELLLFGSSVLVWLLDGKPGWEVVVRIAKTRVRQVKIAIDS